MKKYLILTVVTVIVSFLAMPAGACESCYKKQTERNECKRAKLESIGGMLWSNKDYLGLTEEQLELLKDIKHTAIKDMIRLNAEVDVVEVDLKSEMWKPMIALDRVNGLLDQKFDAKIKISKTFVKAVADMQQVLSEDQRAKAFKLAMKSKMMGEDGACPMKFDGGKGPKMQGGAKVCPITGIPLKTDKAPLKAEKGPMKATGKDPMADL